MPDVTSTRPRIHVDVVFGEDDRRAALLDETFWSLREEPKQVSPKWLYDEHGSLLFDEITRLPEYYPTRAEREILERRSREIARLARADTLVELGSGTSEKTRLLLDALYAEKTLRCFAPFDVSHEMLQRSARDIARRYPGIGVHAVVGDFERHLASVPRGAPRLLAFLGGTIGNLYPDERVRFLHEVAETLAAGDRFLLGVDLVKDPARLEAAYNDPGGVTEAFVRNALTVLNRELGSHFDQSAFAFEARWDAEHEWMDIGMRSLVHQEVALPELETILRLEAGELLRIEVSAKFRRAAVEDELAAAGMAVERWWTDATGDFGLLITTPK